jgi:small subunit ribosomal protein S2
MTEVTIQDLLDNGVHFGHLKSKWNPNMKPYIFMEKNGIHLIDLKKTHKKLEAATAAAQNIAKTGKKILFVATKKQARGIIEDAAKRVNMPFATERWLGGMLTNFTTVRKSIKKMSSIDKMIEDGTIEKLAKKERLILERERQKLEAVLGALAGREGHRGEACVRSLYQGTNAASRLAGIRDRGVLRAGGNRSPLRTSDP